MNFFCDGDSDANSPRGLFGSGVLGVASLSRLCFFGGICQLRRSVSTYGPAVDSCDETLDGLRRRGNRLRMPVMQRRVGEEV